MAIVQELQAAPVEAEKQLPERGKPQPAVPGQALTFIIVDRKYFYHRTYAKAQQEKRYLAAKFPDKTFKCLKVLSIGGEKVPLYQHAPELRTALIAMKEAAEGLTTWGAGPAAWERAMETYKAALSKADLALSKSEGE